MPWCNIKEATSQFIACMYFLFLKPNFFCELRNELFSSQRTFWEAIKIYFLSLSNVVSLEIHKWPRNIVQQCAMSPPHPARGLKAPPRASLKYSITHIILIWSSYHSHHDRPLQINHVHQLKTCWQHRDCNQPRYGLCAGSPLWVANVHGEKRNQLDICSSQGLLAPSGALVVIMVYYIPSSAAQQTHFFRFFKFFRF